MSRRKIKRKSTARRPRGAHARQATPGQIMEHEMRRNRKTAELRRKTDELKAQVAKAKADAAAESEVKGE